MSIKPNHLGMIMPLLYALIDQYGLSKRKKDEYGSQLMSKYSSPDKQFLHLLLVVWQAHDK